MIRPLGQRDLADAEVLLDATVAGRMQARLDEVHDVLAMPGFGAWHGDLLVGVATFAATGDRVELAALAVADDRRRRGFGGALVDAVVGAAARDGAREVWLVTTNDNLEALGLYQRRGFRLRELRSGAVDRARAVKPAISRIGRNGIPMHDELVLARDVP